MTLTNDPNQDARNLAINLRSYIEKNDFASTEERFLAAELQKCLSLLPSFSSRKTQEFQKPSSSADRNEINPNQNDTGIQLPVSLKTAEENPTSNAAMDSNFTATHPTIDESRLHPGFDETELVVSENSHQNDERSSGAEQPTRSIQRSQATDESKPISNSTENKEIFTKIYTFLENSTDKVSSRLAKSDQKRQNRKSTLHYNRVRLCRLCMVLCRLALLPMSCYFIYCSILYWNEKISESPDDYIESGSSCLEKIHGIFIFIFSICSFFIAIFHYYLLLTELLGYCESKSLISPM